MIDKVDEKNCVGCKVCGDICPKQAISFSTNEEGFWYPHIDPTRCICCNLCETACPAINRFYASSNSRTEPTVYKAFHKDGDVRYNSTSGGLFFALADSILQQGGYIVGCAYREDNRSAYHMISNSQEGLQKIRRSKYFQSDTEGIYRSVKTLLDSGERVLFCGTPCQVSALYGFLKKKYEGLFSVDFICRGINSPLAFSKYMDELESRYHHKIVEVHFKNKLHGWLNLGTLVTFENGKKYYRNKQNDPWVNAYVVGNLYMRPSCGECHYKQFPRGSDITMGDFWGLEFTDDEKKMGVSVALVNTDKGDQLLNNARDHLVLEERTLQEALNGNRALVCSAPQSPKRKEFFRRIQSEPYTKVVWSLMESNPAKRIYRQAKETVKSAIRRLARPNH